MLGGIKLYHIVHIDKLESIIGNDMLLSDAEVRSRSLSGTAIGMDKIKERRLNTPLTSHPMINVGECVPFYFCPRSPMLYIFDRDNHPDIQYHGGQKPIIHLVVEMDKAINWANDNSIKWAFTDSNAGSSYFNDFNDIMDLEELDWEIIHSNNWSGNADKKMSEFLIHRSLPWRLIEKIGVYSLEYYTKVSEILSEAEHHPPVKIERQWYY